MHNEVIARQFSQLTRIMATMVNNITLTIKAGQLDNEEWVLLLKRLTCRFGKDWFLDFFKQRPSAEAAQAIEMMTDILHLRIQARQDLSTTKSDCIERVSAPVLAHIASYLRQEQYAAFEQSNRAIYLACNSPNRLQHIEILGDGWINLGKYSFLRSLNMSYKLACTVPVSRLDMSFAHLRRLCICSPSFWDFLDAVDTVHILRFICKFPALQELSLESTHVTINEGDAPPQVLRTLPRNLQALTLGRFSNRAVVQCLMKVYSTRIHCLKCVQTGMLNVADDALNFESLQIFEASQVDVRQDGTCDMAYLVSNAPDLHVFKCSYVTESTLVEFLDTLRALVQHSALEEVIIKIQYWLFASFCRSIRALLQEGVQNWPVGWHCTIVVECTNELQDLNHQDAYCFAQNRLAMHLNDGLYALAEESMAPLHYNFVSQNSEIGAVNQTIIDDLIASYNLSTMRVSYTAH